MNNGHHLTPKQQEFLFHAKAKLKERELLTQELTRRLDGLPAGVRDKYGSLATRVEDLHAKARKVIDHMTGQAAADWSDMKKELKRTLRRTGKDLRKLKWRVAK
jgi:hypothetical protein